MSDKLQSLHPMTGLQESLFAFETETAHGDGASAYVEQFSCKLNGLVDREALSAAWKDLSDRHAALRTAFVRSREGRAVQAVLTARPPSVRSVGTGGEASVPELALSERGVRFDLARDPLLRVVLVPEANGSCAMIVTFHHLILDAWSAPTLISDLMALYARRLGRGPVLAPAAGTTTGTLADSQTARRGAAARAYWAARLHGSRVAALPVLDTALPPGQKAAVVRRLPGHLDAGIRAFAARQSVSPSAVLHAAWGVVLARLSDQTDVVFASVMANRSHDLPDIDRAVGLFAATLPVRVTLSQGQSFATLCRDMQAQLRDAPLWSALPLADILAAAGLRADRMDHTMIGRPAGLAWGESDSLDFPAAGLSLNSYSAHSWDHYDFQIGFSLGEAPYLEARHDLNRVPAGQVDMLLTLTLDLLDRLLTRGADAVTSVPLCGPDMPSARLCGGGDTAQGATLCEAALAGDPALDAVGDMVRTLDRATLTARVAQTAAALAEGGVAPGDRVAVAAVQDAEFTVRALACWRMGAAFVPVNPAWPEERQQQILDTARPKLALGLPGMELPHLRAAEAVAPDSAGLAYCIYTSGSTGVPKGVAVPHRALASYCQSVAETFGFSARDRALQVTSPAFDLGYTTAFGVLAVGGAVYWLGAEAAVDPDQALRVMATRRITVVKATPTYLHLLLSTPDPARFAALTRWRLLILGGESPDADQIDHLSRLCPWLHLACHYGPTETTVGCAMTAPRPIRDWTADRTTIIGTPVRGTEIRIVDRHGDTLPRGVRGEIAVGGTALARGYLPPAQPDGFTRIGGQRFYRTGDLGSLGTDGMLRFAGRRDGIGKIRGHRVDPEETRLALLRDGSVAEAAVAVQGAGPKAQLVAFVRTSDGLRDPARLRAAVARRLPSAQVPQRFVFLSRLLMTENGKTDTAAMLAALGAEPRRTGPGSPPRTATERHLARIWTEVLGLDSVARDDDFFLLGGHSLRAIEVSGALEREGGLRLPLRWFTDAPVLCDLAARIDAAQAGGAARPVVPVSAIMRLYGTDDAAGMLCFPGPMGNSGIYREWLETLAPGCAVDGVDDLPELDAAADVPAMVRWILEQAPDGGRGYRVLLGWSFGADLAYEAAAQLGALGIAPLLVMLDRLPGEPQFGPALGDSPLETRRYWSQVLGVLSSALPESDVARYKAQFAQRAARQRAYEPPTPSAARIACVLSAADGTVAPGRIDHLATLSGQRACISAKGADHFNLFHPPHVARWSVALRRLITERLTGAQAEPDEPAHPPPAARQTFAINEVEV